MWNLDLLCFPLILLSEDNRSYLCLCRVSIAIVRTLPGQQTHHTDLSKTKNVLQRASLSYFKWNAQLQQFSELNSMSKWAKADAFYRLQNLEALGSLTWPALHPLLPVPALLLSHTQLVTASTHPSLHVSTLGHEVTSARITQTGRIQRAHGLGANPDSLPCFEILSKLINYFELFADPKNKKLQCIGVGIVVRTKTKD